MYEDVSAAGDGLPDESDGDLDVAEDVLVLEVGDVEVEVGDARQEGAHLARQRDRVEGDDVRDLVRLEQDDVGGRLHVAQEEALLDLVHLGDPATAGAAHFAPVQRT